MADTETSLSQALWQRTLDRVVTTLGLEEQLREDGGPYLPLDCKAPMYEVGIFVV